MNLKALLRFIATASKAEHAVALGYIVHRMYNVKKKKGAIVLYFKNKNELAIEDQEKHIDKLRDMIKSIEENKDKVEELQSKLKSAIETQDFESAIEIRNELRKYE